MGPALRHDVHAPHDTRLPAVDRAFDLLEILGASNRGLTLSEVSRRLGIPKSSAHYLLYTLLARGYLERSTDGHHFNLGPRACDFANLSLEELELRKVSSPHTQRLARELKMTAKTAVRRGMQAVIIDKYVAYGPTGLSFVGEHIHLHASALGKTLIAYLPDVEVEMLVRGHPLTRLTSNTICSLEALKVHLAQVRAKGFAVNDEEDNIGWRTVAAPIFNHIGKVVASICAHGPTSRIPDERIPELGDKVIRVAGDISRELTPR